MISILRPSTPPLALISSAASWAACGIEAPAMACASAMTPILIGSAASAWPAASTRPKAVAPSSERIDVVVMTFLSVLQACAPFGVAGLVIVGFGSLGLIVASRTSPAKRNPFTLARRQQKPDQVV